MIEILLIVTQWWIQHPGTRSVVRPTPPLARVARPQWNQATPFLADEVSNETPWPESEKVAPFVDGIPPSPAILNAKGWKNVAGVLGWSFGGPLQAAVPFLDSRSDPKDLSPVTAEVADLIARWEKADSVSPRGFEFHRTAYDLSREVETRSTGWFRYVSPNEGGLYYAADTSRFKSASPRRNAQGKQFVLEAGSSEEWVWTEREILHINNTDKTYAVGPLPFTETPNPNGLFRQTIDERAPFIIDIRGDVLRREWSFKLLRQDGDEWYLEAIPRTAARRAAFSKCLLRLDAKSARLTAIKYVDAGQVHETVYVLDRFHESKTPTGGCRFGSPLSGREGRLKGYVNVPMTPK